MTKTEKRITQNRPLISFIVVLLATVALLAGAYYYKQSGSADQITNTALRVLSLPGGAVGGVDNSNKPYVYYVGAGDIAGDAPKKKSNYDIDDAADAEETEGDTLKPAQKTAALVQSYINTYSKTNPVHVFTLGDNAYDHGSPKNYHNRFEPSWGQIHFPNQNDWANFFHPNVGNHEYYFKGGIEYKPFPTDKTIATWQQGNKKKADAALKALTDFKSDARNFFAWHAAPYFQYFKSKGVTNIGTRDISGIQGPWYAVTDIPGWVILNLNSSCSSPEEAEASGISCSVGSPQYNWLKAQLDQAQNKCILATWHHPRFSAATNNYEHGKGKKLEIYKTKDEVLKKFKDHPGFASSLHGLGWLDGQLIYSFHGSNPGMQPFWELLNSYGADVVMTGHAHDYERFAPMGSAMEWVPIQYGQAINNQKGNLKGYSFDYINQDEGRKTRTVNGQTEIESSVNQIDYQHGIREFVVGTGGGNTDYFRTPDEIKYLYPGKSIAVALGRKDREDKTTVYGVLALKLTPDGYSWEFRDTTGKVLDDPTMNRDPQDIIGSDGMVKCHMAKNEATSTTSTTEPPKQEETKIKLEKDGELVKKDSKFVAKLKWTITQGDPQTLKIHDPNHAGEDSNVYKKGDTAKSGTYEATITKRTTYSLTAFDADNKELTKTEVSIPLTNPTPTPTQTPTATPTPTPTVTVTPTPPPQANPGQIAVLVKAASFSIGSQKVPNWFTVGIDGVTISLDAGSALCNVTTAQASNGYMTFMPSTGCPLESGKTYAVTIDFSNVVDTYIPITADANGNNRQPIGNVVTYTLTAQPLTISVAPQVAVYGFHPVILGWVTPPPGANKSIQYHLCLALPNVLGTSLCSFVYTDQVSNINAPTFHYYLSANKARNLSSITFLDYVFLENWWINYRFTPTGPKTFSFDPIGTNVLNPPLSLQPK